MALVIVSVAEGTQLSELHEFLVEHLRGLRHLPKSNRICLALGKELTEHLNLCDEIVREASELVQVKKFLLHEEKLKHLFSWLQRHSFFPQVVKDWIGLCVFLFCGEEAILH